MEYMVIGICIITIVAIGARVLFKRKSKAAMISTISALSKVNEELSPSSQEGETAQDLAIQVEMLPVEAINGESRLTEVTNSEVLARVNNLIPNLIQGGNIVNNATQAAQAQEEVVYRAIIPAGAKLANSREIEGAARAIFHDANGIQGHANLVAVETQKSTAIVASTVAATMGVASMVVGQYYMTQINAELGQISNGISKVSDFQDNEYWSRVFSLVNHVKKISEFQTEILENDELRLSKIAQLDNLEEECTKLLGQANLTLEDFAKKTEIEFEAYEKDLQEAQNWYIYQNTLLKTLYKLSDLRFTLHLGAVSRDQCTALLPTYTQQVEETQTHLSLWHQETTERLSIDTAETRRKRAGWDMAVHFIPGLINDEWNFKPISERTARMIDSQSGGYNELYHDSSNLYIEDVQLISTGGKIYYLPPRNN